jgi:hypothetical protein
MATTDNPLIIKLDPEGALVWAHQIVTLGNAAGTGVAVDADLNIYVTGKSKTSVPGSSDNHSGGDDMFVAKMTP